MTERNLRQLFCPLCRKGIADHHIEEHDIDGCGEDDLELYLLRCTNCGLESYVSRRWVVK